MYIVDEIMSILSLLLENAFNLCKTQIAIAWHDTAENESKISCFICYKKIALCDVVKELKCLHMFHDKCLISWSNKCIKNRLRKTKCPFCNQYVCSNETKKYILLYNHKVKTI